jgi:hypothetical protein
VGCGRGRRRAARRGSGYLHCCSVLHNEKIECTYGCAQTVGPASSACVQTKCARWLAWNRHCMPTQRLAPHIAPSKRPRNMRLRRRIPLCYPDVCQLLRTCASKQTCVDVADRQLSGKEQQSPAHAARYLERQTHFLALAACSAFEAAFALPVWLSTQWRTALMLAEGAIGATRLSRSQLTTVRVYC